MNNASKIRLVLALASLAAAMLLATTDARADWGYGGRSWNHSSSYDRDRHDSWRGHDSGWQWHRPVYYVPSYPRTFYSYRPVWQPSFYAGYGSYQPRGISVFITVR